MRGFNELQQKVFDRAKELIENEPWFCGVNITHMPENYEIERDGVEEHAQQMAMDTRFWDDDSLYS